MTVSDYRLIMGREDKVRIYKHTNDDINNPDYEGILVKAPLRSCPFIYSKIQSVIVEPEIEIEHTEFVLNMVHHIFLQ